MFETQKFRNKKCSGDIGLNIKTHASAEVSQDQICSFNKKLLLDLELNTSSSLLEMAQLVILPVCIFQTSLKSINEILVAKCGWKGKVFIVAPKRILQRTLKQILDHMS